jgi:cell division protein FtsI (penicillin-binding protein 3)
MSSSIVYRQSQTVMPDNAQSRINPRIGLVILGITLWSVFILIRLVQLQIFEHASFAQLAAQRQQVRRDIHAPRGVIYDSHMDELATSVTISTAIATPRKIPNIPDVARQLAAILKLDPQELQDLQNRMTDPAHQSYIRIKSGIDAQAESQIEKLGIKGIYVVEESMRVYPNRELASHVLGFVNRNEDGGAGIELKYDKELKGKKGTYSFDIDAHRQSFRVKVDEPPVQGNSLVLSIDKSIQYITDRELAAGVAAAKARGGTAIVMESESGRILALSNYPPFNCNKYNEYKPYYWRNRAVSDFFEPGSTFKVVVAAEALEQGLTRPDEMIDCQMGAITIGGHVFHDHNGYGLLSFGQILEFSSNVGAAKLGIRLGPERLHKALGKFGFGLKTNIDLPAETVGLVQNLSQWSALSIGAISFGQEVGVTSVQIINAINAIANGGYRVRPSIVDRIIDENGDLASVRPLERQRIMSPSTAEAVANAFEGVVLRGTGRKAALQGYRAAGKTGTAQKIIQGQYSKNKYVASFIGFAPLPQPRITVLVQLDEPTGVHYGGDVSAPIFQKIVQETLLQLRIPPDQDLPLPKYKPQVATGGTEDFIPDATPIQQPLTITAMNSPLVEDSQGTITVQVDSDSVSMPDFRGLSKRKVLNRCIDIGIRLQAKGSGIAIAQFPSPGTKIPEGATCAVTFARSHVKESPLTEHVSPNSRRAGSQLSASNRH